VRQLAFGKTVPHRYAADLQANGAVLQQFPAGHFRTLNHCRILERAAVKYVDILLKKTQFAFTLVSPKRSSLGSRAASTIAGFFQTLELCSPHCVSMIIVSGHTSARNV
jgi:hypothetical protein